MITRQEINPFCSEARKFIEIGQMWITNITICIMGKKQFSYGFMMKSEMPRHTYWRWPHILLLASYSSLLRVVNTKEFLPSCYHVCTFLHYTLHWKKLASSTNTQQHKLETRITNLLYSFAFLSASIVRNYNVYQLLVDKLVMLVSFNYDVVNNYILIYD